MIFIHLLMVLLQTSIATLLIGCKSGTIYHSRLVETVFRNGIADHQAGPHNLRRAGELQIQIKLKVVRS